MPPDLKTRKDETAFALDLAKEAGLIAQAYFLKGVVATIKEDNSPVTQADKDCESLIRRRISEIFPGDAILGEEEGSSGNSKSGRKWIIDPIDGTYNFMRGIPIYSILLALEEEGKITLGVVHNPATADTYWAESGGGAWRNDRKIMVSDISSLAESHFCFGAPNRILQDGYWQSFTDIMHRTYRQRGFGDYLNFAYVFEGKAEAMIEVGLKPWDLAPMQIIAQEAGGRYSDLSGGDSIYEGSCLVSNGHVHEQFLALIKRS